jgi:hypothetical protein
MENQGQGQIFAGSLEPMENGASISFDADELSYRSKKDWSILSNIEEADSNMEESSGLSISRQDGVCLCQSGDEQCCRLCEPLGVNFKDSVPIPLRESSLLSISPRRESTPRQEELSEIAISLGDHFAKAFERAKLMKQMMRIHV